MADAADRADVVIEEALNRALEARRPPKGSAGPTCSECGEPNHPKRIEWGLHLCVDCAELSERRGRL